MLIAKLHANRSNTDSLRMIHSYLVVRKQRVKVDNKYNTRQKYSLVCPPRFNTGYTPFQYLHQFESIDIASYVDDTTPYVFYENIDLLSGKLEIETNKIL